MGTDGFFNESLFDWDCSLGWSSLDLNEATDRALDDGRILWEEFDSVRGFDIERVCFNGEWIIGLDSVVETRFEGFSTLELVFLIWVVSTGETDLVDDAVEWSSISNADLLRDALLISWNWRRLRSDVEWSKIGYWKMEFLNFNRKDESITGSSRRRSWYCFLFFLW